MRIAMTVPSDSVDERTLGAALEAATEVARTQIERGRVPPLAVAIDDYGVRWRPEPTPPGQESFDLPQTVLRRGWGDCDDLGPWWAAELLASGEDPDARAIAYQSGPRRWHVVVERGDGSIDDPSRWAGMSTRIDGVRIPMRDHRASDHPVIGVRQTRGGVIARLDVPTDDVMGVVVERAAPDALRAIERACCAAGLLALWGAPDDVLARLAALASAARGEPGDYEAHGDFVAGLAGVIDMGQAADLAATLIDPLGLRHLAAPLAQQFVSSYAQGLATRNQPTQTSSTSSPSTAKVSGGSMVGRDGGGARGARGGRGASGRGASARGATRGASGRGAGGRDDGGRSRDASTSTSALEQDWATGLYVDPDTGLLIDPFSGGLLSADLQWLVDPTTGVYIGPSSFAMMSSYGGYAGYGTPSYGGYAGYGTPSYGAYGTPYGTPYGYR